MKKEDRIISIHIHEHDHGLDLASKLRQLAARLEEECPLRRVDNIRFGHGLLQVRMKVDERINA